MGTLEFLKAICREMWNERFENQIWFSSNRSSITEKFTKFLLNHEARDKQSVKSCSIVFFGERQKPSSGLFLFLALDFLSLFFSTEMIFFSDIVFLSNVPRFFLLKISPSNRPWEGIQTLERPLMFTNMGPVSLSSF